MSAASIPDHPLDRSQLIMADSEQVEQIKLSIKEAERDVDIAERHLKDSQIRLTYLKNQLQEVLISGVSGLKVVDHNNNIKEPAYKPPENEDEASRKARVRRRWRVLGMKIKFGLVAQAMAVKRRNLQDASSFIDKESEVWMKKLIFLSCFNICQIFSGSFKRRSIGLGGEMSPKEGG